MSIANPQTINQKGLTGFVYENPSFVINNPHFSKYFNNQMWRAIFNQGFNLLLNNY